MPKTFDEVLEICIERINSGSGTIESCLADFPQFAHELNETLPLVASVKSFPQVEPSPQFSKNARVRITAKLPDRPVTFWGSIRRILSEPRLLSKRRFGMTQIIMTIILALSLLAGGSYAVQASGPGDILYGIDLAAEQVRLKLTSNLENHTALQLKLATERLQEAEKKLNAGKIENAGEALFAYSQIMNQLQASVQNQGELNRLALRSQVQEELGLQQGILERIRLNWPEGAQAQNAYQNAYQNALQRTNMGVDDLLGPPEFAPQGPSDDVPQGPASENAQGPSDEAPQGPDEDAPQGPDEMEPGGPNEDAPLGPTEEAPHGTQEAPLGPSEEAPNGPINNKP